MKRWMLSKIFLGCITTDLCELLFEKGITDRRGIFCMGDWPWIAKAGCLTRTFYNAAKRASSKKDPTGVLPPMHGRYPRLPVGRLGVTEASVDQLLQHCQSICSRTRVVETCVGSWESSIFFYLGPFFTRGTLDVAEHSWPQPL